MLTCRTILNNIVFFSASRMQRCPVHSSVTEAWNDFWPKYNTSLFSVIMTCNTCNCLLFHARLRKTNVYDEISNLPAVLREHTVCTMVHPMLSARCLSCPWRWSVVCCGWMDDAVTWQWRWFVWVFNNGQLQSAVSQFRGHYCACSCILRSRDISMPRDTGLNGVVMHGVLCKIIND